MKNEKSIFYRILIGYLIISFLFGFIFLYTSLTEFKKYSIYQSKEFLKRISFIFLEDCKNVLLSKNLDEINAFNRKIRYYYDNTNIRITLIDIKGDVISDPQKGILVMENHIDRVEVKNALKGEDATSLRFSKTLNIHLFYFARPLYENEKIIGVMRVSMPIKDIFVFQKRIIRHAIIYTLILIFIAFIFSLTFTKGIVHPINTLISTIDLFTRGRLDVRVKDIYSINEIRKLAFAFNQMASQIELMISNQISEKERFKTIISKIPSGIVVIDNKEKIDVVNDEFIKIIGQEDCVGRYYWEIIRNTKFVELIKKANENLGSVKDEVTIDLRTFLCIVIKTVPHNEIVCILHDITYIKELQNLKKEFVANISHELRTPLTAIKGFVETLKDETKDKRHIHYLNIIAMHTERLISIVKDLLLISQIEEKANLIRFERIDIKEIINDIISLFKNSINAKRLYINIEFEKDLPNICADPYLINQMIINLIDNAIKYTDKGGISINVKRQKDMIVIEVSDTGIGISKQDMPKIFDRFYVVDKARSRQYGGTGLGLSIVKNIVLAHNGSIDVKSTLGLGTSFIISLPIEQPPQNI